MTSRLCCFSRVLRGCRAVYPFVLGSLAVYGAAEAAPVSISTATTAPLATATADPGPPVTSGDITITNTGSITLPSGTALTLNSSNSITNNGIISISDVDNSIGISIAPGFSGGVTNASNIELGAAITDPAIIHPNHADNKRGIILNSGGSFTGDIKNSLGVTVRGDSSVGVDLQGALIGNFDGTGGTINVRGDNSAGIRVAAPVTGNVIGGTTFVQGINSSGILVTAPISGAFKQLRAIQVTGYDITTPSTATGPTNHNDTQKLQQSGPGIGIGANVGAGVLINGPTAADLAAVDAGTKASAELVPQATIAMAGSANGLLISPRLSPAPANIQINAVGVGADAFGVINRGTIDNDGVYDGIDAEAVRIEGARIGLTDYSTTIAGGFVNDSAINAEAVKANSRALVIGNLASVPTILNTKTITTSSVGAGNFSSTALLLEAGANVPTLINEGTGVIASNFSGPTGNATAIRDLSGNLTNITNRGFILGIVQPDPATPTVAPTGTGIAADFSATSNDITFTNELPANFNADLTPTAGQVRGDMLFGSGSDHLIVNSGLITGNVTFGNGNDDVNIIGGQIAGNLAFGAGADAINVNGNALVSGIITDSDGLLTINVPNGALGITSTNAINITQASFGATGVFGIAVQPSANAATRLTASGPVVFLPGAKISPIFFGAIGSNLNATIVSSPDLQITGDPNALLSATVPFFYTVSLNETSAGGIESLNMVMSLKSAQQLGISPTIAPALAPMLAALSNDATFEAQFLLASTQQAFNDAFIQMLPSYTDAELAMEKHATKATSRQIRERLENVLRARRGGGAWANEALYSLDRSADGLERGYDAQGAVLSFGLDDLLTENIALGLTFGLDHGSYTESGDFDDPVSLRRWVGGFYAGGLTGNLLLSGSMTGALTTQSVTRQVIVGTSTRITEAEWHGWRYAADTSASYLSRAGRWSFTPTLGVNYLHINEAGYTEDGGFIVNSSGVSSGNAVALQVDSRSGDSASVYSELVIGFDLHGRQAVVAFEPGQPYVLRPEIKLGFSYDLINSPIDTTARFVGGGPSFTIPSDERNSQDVSTGLGFTFQTDFGTIGGDANAVFGDNTNAFVGKLNASFRF